MKTKMRMWELLNLEDNLTNYSRQGRQHGVCREGTKRVSRKSKWRGNVALDLYSGSVRFKIRVEHRVYPHLRFFTVPLKKKSQDNVSIWALVRPCKMFIHIYIHTYTQTQLHKPYGPKTLSE